MPASPPEIPPSLCESCPDTQLSASVAVVAVPGVPYSAPYCRRCLAEGVIPLWIAVSNTAAIDGLEHASGWWVDVVEKTLAWNNMSREDFETAVAHEVADMNATEEGSRLADEDETGVQPWWEEL